MAAISRVIPQVTVVSGCRAILRKDFIQLRPAARLSLLSMRNIRNRPLPHTRVFCWLTRIRNRTSLARSTPNSNGIRKEARKDRSRFWQAARTRRSTCTGTVFRLGERTFTINNPQRPLGGHAFTMLEGIAETPSTFVPGRPAHRWISRTFITGSTPPTLSDRCCPRDSCRNHSKRIGTGNWPNSLKASRREPDCLPHEQTHLRTGAAPFHEICKLAQEIPANLVVMPTHGYTGLKHAFLGSTAERVVQHSPCPVFISREKKQLAKTGRRLSISTILVPVDFSSCSREGLQYAIAFAKEFGAKIILLHATYLGYIYSAEDAALYDIPSLQEAARKNAEHQMRKLLRTVNFGGVKFSTAFTEGSPALDICAFAKDHDVDLIITSTHGLTGFEHVLIGSNAEKVVRHAPCSVLVVPAHPKIRAANLAKSGGRKTRTSRRSRAATTKGIERQGAHEKRSQTPTARVSRTA